MGITKRPEREELTGFTASNGWLEKSKQIYGVREKDCGEKPVRFPQQQHKLEFNYYQSCARIMSHENIKFRRA